MKQTKIDWCDSTINPVVGCNRGCPYCYARKINERFHIVKDFAQPELKADKLIPLTNKTPKSIFADSMSDPEYWTEEQTAAVIDWMKKSSQNYFMLLTKSPKTLEDIRSREDAKPLFEPGSQKLFLGYSCGTVCLVNLAMMETSYTEGFKADFLSIEPLAEDLSTVGFSILMDNKSTPDLRLVIIGAETGNRKGKVECKKEWVDNIVEICDKRPVKVFMKSSLKEIMGKSFRQDELPWPVGKKEVK